MLTWDCIGVEELLNFVRNSKNEDHDAIVYDIFYEFDPDDKEVTETITYRIIKRMGYDIIEPKYTIKDLESRGLVCQVDRVPDNGMMRYYYLKRKEREKDPEANLFYEWQYLKKRSFSAEYNGMKFNLIKKRYTAEDVERRKRRQRHRIFIDPEAEKLAREILLYILGIIIITVFFTWH